MRSIGILLLISSILTIAAPQLRDDLLFLSAFSDQALWIVGGSLLVVGVVIVVTTRQDD